MSYRSILVNLDMDGPVAPIVNLAVDLARRFDARLVGFSAADAAMPPIMAPEGGAIAVEVWQQMREDIQKRFKELHAAFDEQVAGAVGAEWRDTIDTPTRALSAAARLVDLIVTSASKGATTGDTYRAADPGSVVLQAGRPLLVAASGAEHVPAQKIVIAWKDTREARRAVADAVPLLLSANEVIIVTVDAKPDDWIRAGVKDVAAFLAAHGVKARAEVLLDNDEAYRLTEFIASIHADLVVSGAYGHSRVREWAFGGVTRSLLDEIGLNRFMSS
jgi:nucleotide-binding universal stress UspA family protein